MNDLISRQAAIDALSEFGRYKDTLAVQIIEDLPSEQSDSKETSSTHKALDTISRQAAIDLWEQYHPYIATKACEYDAMLRQLPSAQPTEASCWGCNCPKMERLKEQKTFSEMVHLHDKERREE